MTLESSTEEGQAAQIVASGEWDGLKVRLRELAANSSLDNQWWFQLIGSLYTQSFSEYARLKRAYENEDCCDPPLLAWRARNLLELVVWSRYCERGRENARRLYADAGRDTRELYEKFLAFGKAGHFTGDTPSDWSKPFDDALQALNERARAEGIASLETNYLSVYAAADECGISEKFSLVNKMLSKFAHPTALRIMAPPDRDREKLQRTHFMRWGCLFFIGIFRSLESQLRAKDAHNGLAEDPELRPAAAET